METKQSEVTTVIYGLYGGAVYKHNKWKVIGGHSPNSKNDCIYVINLNCLSELDESVPVYASCNQFNGKIETTDFVTKRELFETAKEFLEKNELLVTNANIQCIAENALSICDWQDIKNYILTETDASFDTNFLPDKI